MDAGQVVFVGDEEGDEPKENDVIKLLGDALLSKRDEAVKFRASSGVEHRWSVAEETINSELPTRSRAIDYAIGEGKTQTSGPKRSKVVINVIRGKCETAEGRFAGIQMPIDDKNWGMRPTPVPELIHAMKDGRPAATRENVPIVRPDGAPVRISDVAKNDKEAAIEAMKGMEGEIDDQLSECRFNDECRKAIRNSVRLGTGILKGPNVIKQLKHSWTKEEGMMVSKISESFRPMSKSVSPWNVYPDPECDENIRSASYIWERSEILPRNIRMLIGVPGYLTDQIMKILKEEPIHTVATENGPKSLVTIKNSYEMWEYYGDLSKSDIEALGVNTDSAESETVSACVVFVNDRPIKAVLNTLDTGELPYDFFQWTTAGNSPWGLGIPDIALWQQRVLTAAWRSMMDNAGDSSGSNIVIGEGIEPDDGKWEITGKKIWRATGEIEDVRAAFAQFQPLSYQRELQNIIELALRFIDMETSLPMMFQGEKGEMPRTLGATNILVDSNNVALRSRVKLWDDFITRPHISRYYNWNMQYSDNEKIKGDYLVDVRGASVLFEKDQQISSLLNLMQFKADPDINKLVDWQKAIKQLFTAMRLDVLKEQEDIEEPPPAQEEPQIVTARIKAQAEIEKAKMSQQALIEEIQLKREAAIMELQEKARDAEAERMHAKEMKAVDFKIKQMEYASASGISLEKIKAELSIGAARIGLQRELSSSRATGPQVLKPEVEPAGIASQGRSFTE
jgi:hypothetical protein